MTTLTLVLILILIAIVLWLVPMNDLLQKLFYAIGIISLLLWVMSLFGVLPAVGIR